VPGGRGGGDVERTTSTVLCRRCGHDNPGGRKFCATCGGELGAERCPACGAAADDGARYCGECGAPFGADTLDARPSAASRAAERKQITVLFADVEGSMGLQESLDPEQWARIMGRLVRILADGVRRFGGTVDKFTGDGIMALFGAPVALEDHARRACLAALHLTAAAAGYADELRRSSELDLRVRVGLNSGEVIVGRVGDDVRLDATALGHAVGLAQRMEAIAEPGRGYLTEHTARLVRGRFRLADLGMRNVKGARTALRVFALEGPTDDVLAGIADRGLGVSPLIGRDHDLSVLHECLAAAAQGETQVLAVIGEAGVGKSRLCDEFVRSAASRGIRVHRTTGVSHGQDVPLLPILALLRDYFDIDDSDTPANARERVRHRVLRLDAALGDDLPLLFDLLEVADPERPPPRLAPDVRMDRIVDVLGRITARRGARETLVVLAEDLHWFDPQSVVFLRRLIAAFAGSRTLTVVNLRPELDVSVVAGSDWRELHLDSLPAGAVGDLLTAVLGRDASLAPLVHFVLDRTAGNPFFVEEVVRALVEDGTLRGTAGAYRLTRPLEEVRVPPSVHAVLAARIDRLSGEHKEVLETAAVIGRTFSKPLLARVADSAHDLDDALAGLLAAQLLQLTSAEPFPEYRFWHPLTHEVAYGTLVGERRSGLHAAVANAVIASAAGRLDELAAVLAWHWERADRPVEAARWHLRAGEYAARSSLAEAQHRWRSAAEALVDSAPTSDAIEIGVRARARLLQFGARTGIDATEAERLYAEGRALAEQLDDVGLLGLLITMAGSARFWRGDVQGALARVQEVAALESPTTRPELLAELRFGLGFVLAYAGTPHDALAATELVLEAADGDPDRGAALMGYSPLARTHQVRAGIMARAGRLDDAAAEVERCLRLARPRGEVDTVAWALAVHPQLDWLRGCGGDGVAASEEALRIATDTGNAGALVLALEGTALVRLAAGDPERAEAACRRALDEARRRQSGLFEEPRLLITLASARLAADDGTGGLAAANEAVSIAVSRGMATDECLGRLVQARSRAAAGATASSVGADLDAALGLARRIGARSYEPFILEERARLDGDVEALRDAARVYESIGATGHARRVRGLVELGARADRPHRRPTSGGDAPPH
jgi:class 3 adenylate cyclase/tetratricopeptide (TPR) repeat protein